MPDRSLMHGRVRLYVGSCLFFMLAALCTAPAPGQAAGPETSEPSFLCPEPLPRFGSSFYASLSQAELPEDIIQVDATFRAPLLALSGRLGLAGPLLAEASVSSNLVTWHVALGPKIVVRRDHLRVAAGYDVAFWLGRLTVEGFDTRIQGWIHYPNFTVGYRFEHFALSLSGRLLLSTALSSKVGDLEVTKPPDPFAGFSVDVAVEQPLWKEQMVALGVRLYWTKLYYPSWAAFPVFDRHYWIPELNIGVIL